MLIIILMTRMISTTMVMMLFEDGDNEACDWNGKTRKLIMIET